MTKDDLYRIERRKTKLKLIPAIHPEDLPLGIEIHVDSIWVVTAFADTLKGGVLNIVEPVVSFVDGRPSATDHLFTHALTDEEIMKWFEIVEEGEANDR